MQHHYQTIVEWTGNKGEGTSGYRSYSREHHIEVTGKPMIAASSDPAFLGDPTRYNPEELLLASLSSCHMLWYLHLCADNGIIVHSYKDEARGTMQEDSQGGRFTDVLLQPSVGISNEDMRELALQLHYEANTKCFIANSVNFPVRHNPSINIIRTS
jgi:organic hydroperoxide reductase OsmC/OhrA